MKYITAGYYLIRIQPIKFGHSNCNKIYTCSTCINESLLSRFGRYWVNSVESDEIARKEYNIDSGTIRQIYVWTSKMEKAKEIECGFLFYRWKTALEYRNRFFSHLNDVVILGLYLPEKQADKLITEFEPDCDTEDEIGLLYRLKRRELEADEGKVLGYDLIGLEWQTFHSFHCNDVYSILKREYGVRINKHGLISSEDNWSELVGYMNDDDSPVEPVPWYFAKIKLIDN